ASIYNAPPTTHLYTLSLHDALPICPRSHHSWGSGHDRDARAVPIAAQFHRPCLQPDGAQMPFAARLLLCLSLHSIDRSEFEGIRSEEHTSELQSRENLVCRLLLEKK